ncbi:SET domain-containing protein [Pleomassaria siparia CBS 279.74]|uniref:SET domain-containing protein n=1 Tax=Pleomassaria siparia CBS 279.74 TaxID=1314801 RepID=A0A6G1KRA0_9PLEO|nr:SET domain-containing protein [Pleomassaria siparia CBS 279.74]
MNPFDESSHAFIVWLSKCGAEISQKIKLQDLRNIQAGRGVVAVQNIEQDELLFRIPRTAILSVENSILSNEIPKATFEHLGPWLSLIFVMLYEYNNRHVSNWAPYFNVLPTEFNTLMFWEADELEELQGSAVRAKIGKEEADNMFKNQLVPVIREFAEMFFSGDSRARERAEAMMENHNIDLMHKMGSLIMAYAFDLEPMNVQKDVDEEGYASEDEDEALPKGMVPLADMLNADADRNNACLFYEAEFLSMKAIKPIVAGDEIFNDYGPLPRSDLLRRYGYITENYAQYDVVEIPFTRIAQAASKGGITLYEDKIEYLDEHGLIETGYDICASNPFSIEESMSPELITIVETLLLDEDEFERLKRKGKLPKPDQISTRGIEVLHNFVISQRQEYGTTLEQDMRDVPVSPTSEMTLKDRRCGMAKLVRMGEKKILQDAEKALFALLQEKNRTNRVAKRRAEDEHYDLGKRQRGR